MKTVILEEEQTRAISSKMAKMVPTIMTGTKQTWSELINKRAENATLAETMAIRQDIVLKGGQKIVKDIVLRANVLSVAHVVIERQIVGNFPITQTKYPIIGCQGKSTQMWPVH